MKKKHFIIANITIDERMYGSAVNQLIQAGVNGIAAKNLHGNDLTEKIKNKKLFSPLRIFDKTKSNELEKNALVIVPASLINSTEAKKFGFKKGQKIILDSEGSEYNQIPDATIANHVDLYGIILNDFHFKEESHLQAFIHIKMSFPKLKVLFSVTEKNNHINKIQSALDLGFDGLYFEVKKSIDKMISNIQDLSYRTEQKMKKGDKKEFDHLRKKIDKIDDELLHLLSVRGKAIDSVAKIKKENGRKIFQASRWRSILNNSMKKADKAGVNKDMLSEILQAIHADAIRAQMKFYAGKKKK